MNRRRLLACCVLGLLFLGPGCASWDTRVVSGLHTPPQVLDWKARIAEHPLRPGENIRVLELGRTESASYHLVQIRDREVPHVHRRHELTVVVKRGQGELTLGGRTLFLKAGAVVLIPRGMVHHFTNTGSRPAVALTIFTPPFDGKDTVPVTPR